MGPVYLTQRFDEDLDEDYEIQSDNQPSIRVMVWTCITFDKKGPLLILERPEGRGRGMNSERYIEQVLEKPFLPFYESMKQKRRYMSLVQDNNGFHVAKSTMKWFSKNKVKLLPHPPSSPDLNPMKKLWRELKSRIRSRDRLPSSDAELRKAVLDAWESISIDDINALVRSMPEKVNAVLEAKGGHMKH